MENSVYPKLPTQFRELLEHTGTAQQKIAEMVCDELLEFFSPPKFSESEPEILTRYKRMSYDAKVDFDRKYTAWRKGAVENYEKGQRNYELETVSHLHWLNEWADILKGTPREGKLREIIDQYKPNVPKQAMAIAEQFGGKVVNMHRKDWDEEET